LIRVVAVFTPITPLLRCLFRFAWLELRFCYAARDILSLLPAANTLIFRYCHITEAFFQPLVITPLASINSLASFIL